MKAFHAVLLNSLLVTVTNFFVWFAVVFWLYLETRSVIATATAGGIFMIAMSLSSFWMGAIVDHHKKKISLLISTLVTLFFFFLAFLMQAMAPVEAFQSVGNPLLWIFTACVLAAVLASNIRGIALPTLVTMLVPEDRRDKANGLVGMIMGLSSSGAGLTSGFALAYLGLHWILVITLVLIFFSLIHLLFIAIPEERIFHTEEEAEKKQLDLSGTMRVIRSIPGLFPLIFFTTFNNFLGGVFMALMDAYGLELMSVQAWSTLWGVLSLGFIVGGMIIAKFGLGSKPLTTLFRVNIIVWTSCIFFTIQPSIWLLAVGILIWVMLMPFIEATEHTIVQKVVPLQRQGRVFGFAQSVEMAASPITSFLIGPIAQFIFIPFMTTGAGVTLIGDWFGTGASRGMALVFILSGITGLAVTLVAMRSRSYKLLATRYQEEPGAL